MAHGQRCPLKLPLTEETKSHRLSIIEFTLAFCLLR